MNPGMEGTPPRILVVIPAFQEERSIGGLVHSLRERTPYDVLVVNDGSTDRTFETAREAGAIVLDLPCNLGIGGAVQTGFLYARDCGYEILSLIHISEPTRL